MIDPDIKYFYRALVQYKGTHYCGWQIQTSGIMTIQGTFEDCLKKLSQSPIIYVIGSGRTDSGVHAVGQVVRFGLPILIPPEGLKKGLNSVLPDDIRVRELQRCDETFHPQFNALWKTYYYLFSKKEVTAFNFEYVSPAYSDINIAKIIEALAVFKGMHDFKRYQCTGTPIKNTVREMYDLQFFDHIPSILGLPEWPDVYAFKVTGSGFLKQMVRLIAGTVFEYARGKFPLEHIKKSLMKDSHMALGPQEKLHLAPVASPQGLYLCEVGYLPYLS